MKKRLIAVLLLMALALTGCQPNNNPPISGGRPDVNDNIGNDDTTFGDDLKDLGAFDGFFEEETKDINITCVEGTPGAYKMEGSTLTFTTLTANSVYAITGKLSGNIVIDIGEEFDLELELSGFSLVSENDNPITVLSGDEVTIQAKKDTKSFIYDTRGSIPTDDAEALSGAIHSDVDLEISGKGSLTVVSENNNGIHTKKDLQVKNLSLLVSCTDNALKGNDSVSLENANVTAIATAGDGIKTTNSDISTKGNQRGTVSVSGGKCDIYAAYSRE